MQRNKWLAWTTTHLHAVLQHNPLPPPQSPHTHTHTQASNILKNRFRARDDGGGGPAQPSVPQSKGDPHDVPVYVRGGPACKIASESLGQFYIALLPPEVLNHLHTLDLVWFVSPRCLCNLAAKNVLYISTLLTLFIYHAGVIVQQRAHAHAHAHAHTCTCTGHWRDSVAEEPGFPRFTITAEQDFFVSLGNGHFTQALNLYRQQVGIVSTLCACVRVRVRVRLSLSRSCTDNRLAS